MIFFIKAPQLLLWRFFYYYCSLKKANYTALRKIVSGLIASVWLINGVFCKLFNLVPRHEQIVGRILGADNAPLLTKIIGLLELLMGIWIITGFRRRFCAIIQIILIAVMNIIEFFKAPDLLLFGRFNIVVAFLLMTMIFVNEFVLQPGKFETKSLV